MDLAEIVKKDSIEAFFIWLKRDMPYLVQLFDYEKKAYRPKLVENYLGVASTSQVIMAKFALGVWRHDNLFSFNLFEDFLTKSGTKKK